MIFITKNTSLITLASAVLAGAAFTTSASASPDGLPNASFNGFSLGYKYTHYQRHEPDVTQKGGINGAVFGYEHLSSPFYFDFNLSYDTGNVNYNGGAQIPNANGGYTNTPLNDHTNIKALVTYNIEIGPAFSMLSGRNIVAPFIGTGGQYIYSSSSAKSSVSYFGTSYTVPKFEVKNLMTQAQFGVTDRYAVTNKLQIEGKAEGLINLAGVYSDNIGNKGTYSGGDLGYRFKIRADYNLTHHFGVFASGEYYYFQTPKVKKINILGNNSFEPAAKKHEYSAMAGFTFRGI